MAYCNDPGFAAACAPAVTCAPAVAPVGHTSVEAWGRPVYKKKWLFGKWKYSGMTDVKYVPRAQAALVPTAAPPVCAPAVAEYCAPVAEYCAPAAATACYGGAYGYGGACY